MTVYRKLLPGEADRYRDHLLRLDRDDRYARFCGIRSDGAIGGFCAALDWHTAVVIGCFVQGTLRAAAELRTDPVRWPGEGELAISVEAAWQNRGIGAALLRR